jgi:hypothetical protein
MEASSPHLDSEKRRETSNVGKLSPDWSSRSIEKGLDEDDYIANPSSPQETLCTSAKPVRVSAWQRHG